MKYGLIVVGLAIVAYAEQTGAPTAPTDTHSHSSAAGVIFALLIVVFAVLWAYKNKFTDYP
jgi:bacteriorhodopsin